MKAETKKTFDASFLETYFFIPWYGPAAYSFSPISILIVPFERT